MSRTEHTQSVLNLLRKASVPGSDKLKAYWFIMKRRRTVTRHSVDPPLEREGGGREKMMHCLWPHPRSSENVMSKVASAFLHLTETNPQEGLGGPTSPRGGRALSPHACAGFPWVLCFLLMVHRYLSYKWAEDFPIHMNGNVYFSHTRVLVKQVVVAAWRLRHCLS